MKWRYLLVLGSTGCLTIHVHVPPPEPMYLSPYPYAAPPPPPMPRPGETGAVRRPIDESLVEDQRLAAAPPAAPIPPDPKPRTRNEGCEPPYRITDQGIRVMRAECITE